jgi:hypothetical protein
MLLKLAALGALGYAGYRYYENHKDSFRMPSRERPQPALAGGPLSDAARVQDTPDIAG